MFRKTKDNAIKRLGQENIFNDKNDIDITSLTISYSRNAL